MKREYSHYSFDTEVEVNDTEGWVAVKLFRTTGKARIHAASITYWDAMGQSSLNSFAGEIPLGIIEELIAEAKARFAAD
jgi:hypothetical protein